MKPFFGWLFQSSDLKYSELHVASLQQLVFRFSVYERPNIRINLQDSPRIFAFRFLSTDLKRFLSKRKMLIWINNSSTQAWDICPPFKTSLKTRWSKPSFQSYLASGLEAIVVLVEIPSKGLKMGCNVAVRVACARLLRCLMLFLWLLFEFLTSSRLRSEFGKSWWLECGRASIVTCGSQIRDIFITSVNTL